MKDTISTESRSVTKAPPKEGTSRQVKRATARQAAKAQQAAEARRVDSPTVAQCADLKAQLSEPVTDDARAYYLAMLTDDAAARIGNAYAAKSVVDDFLTVVSRLLPSVVARRIMGFGPQRAYFAVELAAQLAARVDPVVVGESAPDGTPSQPATNGTIDDASLRLEVAQALRNLDIEVDPSAPQNAADIKMSHSLAQLADAVRRAQASVPPDVLSDSGLTPAVLDALAKASRDAMGSHMTRGATLTRAQVAARSEDVLAGRLLRETRSLVAAARTSRKRDANIPNVRSALTKRPKKKAVTSTTVAQPAPTAQPAPIAQPAPVSHPSG